MEEARLPLLTGGRSGVKEFSKDRSLGDRQATGPGSTVCCPGAVTEQGAGVSPLLLLAQTLSGPHPEELWDTPPLKARCRVEHPTSRPQSESQPSCATLGKPLNLSEPVSSFEK